MNLGFIWEIGVFMNDIPNQWILDFASDRNSLNFITAVVTYSN